MNDSGIIRSKAAERINASTPNRFKRVEEDQTIINCDQQNENRCLDDSHIKQRYEVCPEAPVLHLEYQKCGDTSVKIYIKKEDSLPTLVLYKDSYYKKTDPETETSDGEGKTFLTLNEEMRKEDEDCPKQLFVEILKCSDESLMGSYPVKETETVKGGKFWTWAVGTPFSMGTKCETTIILGGRIAFKLNGVSCFVKTNTTFSVVTTDDYTATSNQPMLPVGGFGTLWPSPVKSFQNEKKYCACETTAMPRDLTYTRFDPLVTFPRFFGCCGADTGKCSNDNNPEPLAIEFKHRDTSESITHYAFGSEPENKNNSVPENYHQMGQSSKKVTITVLNDPIKMQECSGGTCSEAITISTRKGDPSQPYLISASPCLSGTDSSTLIEDEKSAGGRVLYIVRKTIPGSTTEGLACASVKTTWALSSSKDGETENVLIEPQGFQSTKSWNISYCLARWIDELVSGTEKGTTIGAGAGGSARKTHIILKGQASDEKVLTVQGNLFRPHLVCGLIDDRSPDKYIITDANTNWKNWMTLPKHTNLDVGTFPINIGLCNNAKEPGPEGTHFKDFGSQSIVVQMINIGGSTLSWEWNKSSSAFVPANAAGEEICKTAPQQDWWCNMNIQGGSLVPGKQQDATLKIESVSDGSGNSLYPGVYKCNIDIKVEGIVVQTLKCRLCVPDSKVGFFPAGTDLT